VSRDLEKTSGEHDIEEMSCSASKNAMLKRPVRGFRRGKRADRGAIK